MRNDVFVNTMILVANTYVNFKLTDAGLISWFSSFEKYTDQQFVEAVNQYIENEEWAPQSPKSIIKYIEKQTKGELNAEQAYILVVKAIQRYGFSKLNEAKEYLMSRDRIIWDAINSRVDGWRGACYTDAEKYERSFKKTYAALKEAHKDKEYRSTLPNSDIDLSKRITTQTKKIQKDYSNYKKFDVFNPSGTQCYKSPTKRINQPTDQEVERVMRMYMQYFPEYEEFKTQDIHAIRETLKAGYTFDEFERVAKYKSSNRKTKGLIDLKHLKGTAPTHLYGIDSTGYWINCWLTQEMLLG